MMRQSCEEAEVLSDQQGDIKGYEESCLMEWGWGPYRAARTFRASLWAPGMRYSAIVKNRDSQVQIPYD